MKATSSVSLTVFLSIATIFVQSLHAKIITVNTTNPTSTPALTNLATAISLLEDGDTIQFNIPGSGPHYIQTPAGGYPLITKNNVGIDGYTQPGSVPNTNPILAANNAQIKIVLSSTNGNFTPMNYDPANSGAGFDDTEFAVLGIYGGTNVQIRGLCVLGVPGGGLTSHYGIAIARNFTAPAENGHINGCWIGVDLDRTNVFGFDNGIAAFRHTDGTGANPERPGSNGQIIGVRPGSANARSEFNVIVGATINIILEGQRHRISGNFIGVLPSGIRDYIPPFAELGRIAESHIEIGRGASDLVIGTDGDGVNDGDERNIFGGVVTDGSGGSFNLNGYDHVIELYSLSSSPGPDRTNVKIAGNYVGVGVDGVTRFTNGVPAMNGSAATDSQYWIGSDFDGISDDLEANVIYNNYPPGLFYDSPYTNSPAGGSGSHGFFDQPSSSALYSVRGNVTVNNYPFPVNPGQPPNAPYSFITNYVNKALLNPTDTFTNLLPVISTGSTRARLIGTVPAANATFPWTILDLYIPDPQGLTNGLVAPDPNLPYGWIQGLTYLGSFVDNGVLDLNTNAGAFEFNLSSLGLASNTTVTVSANYSKDPPGTHNGRTMTALFSYPVSLPDGVFIPGGAESIGLTHIVPDRIIYNTATANLDNWEPFASVLGTSTFLVEANTFADDGTLSNQRFALAFQPVTGGIHGTGEVFYADSGTPYRGSSTAVRQNGNPGRVAGDKRPGAVNFIASGETSFYQIAGFQSDTRWSTYTARYGADTRFGTVQTYSLNTSTFTQSPLMKAFDVVSGRITTGSPANVPEVSRFGGELVALDDGNFVVVVDDRSGFHDPARAAVAVIIRPDGSIAKETFVVEANQIWSNVAAHKGGFCVRVGVNFYFYDNNGNVRGQSTLDASGIGFDTGRGDGTRIASHINSPYVYLAGVAPDGAGLRAVRMAVWDSRNQTFVTATNVSELTSANGGSDTADFLPSPDYVNPASFFDRVNLAVDALDRVTVAYEARPVDGAHRQQTVARVLAFNTASQTFRYLTHSFHPFVNHGQYEAAGTGFGTLRPSVAVTTRQICIAAKGEINSTNNPAGAPDTLLQTTFYSVISHPDPQTDPTPAVGGGGPTLSVARSGGTVTISWPTGVTGFILEETATLTNPAWGTVGGVVNNSVNVTAGSGNKFYRLRQ